MAEAAPCEVWFYHLERSALDQVLPQLLERTLANGWRALVRSPLSERMEHLDGWLWSWRDDSFLPHGLADEPLADRQPVLLTTGQDNPNMAQALFLIDDAEPGDVAGFARCFVLFDGRDDTAIGAARERWRVFKSKGLPVAYWRQQPDGKWEKQA
jgi:DNA polymerase-3 subunit chi